MGPLDALWHLLNFFAPAVLVSALACGLTKLLWWRALRTDSWGRLWLWTATGAALASAGGLVLFGHDGQMATYAAMVVVCALVLWWRAFLSG